LTVILAVPEEEVIIVDARPIIAVVKNKKAVGNFS